MSLPGKNQHLVYSFGYTLDTRQKLVSSFTFILKKKKKKPRNLELSIVGAEEIAQWVRLSHAHVRTRTVSEAGRLVSSPHAWEKETRKPQSQLAGLWSQGETLCKYAG